MKKAKNPTKKGDYVKRIATVAAVWTVARALETRRLSRTSKKIDKSIASTTARAGSSLKKVGRNARHHPALLVAGVAALAVGAGLLGRASMK